MKNKLRKEILGIRNNITEIYEQTHSNIIFEKITALPEYINAHNVMVYFSAKHEVRTDKITQHAITSGKCVYAPKVTDGENMVALKYDGKTEVGAFGILEPCGEKIAPEDIELIIVPGVVFDKKGNRIGYGKGYYDRFLKNTHAYTVGLAYTFQITDEIKSDANDIAIDRIITG